MRNTSECTRSTKSSVAEIVKMQRHRCLMLSSMQSGSDRGGVTLWKWKAEQGAPLPGVRLYSQLRRLPWIPGRK